MDNIVTLCLLAVFLVVGFMLLSRLMRSYAGNSGGYGERGPESPRYDDPDIDSRGGFGGSPSGGVRPTHDDPNIRSRGSFGRPRSPFGGGRPSSSGGSGGKVNSPTVRSRGGFGRSKD